MKKKDPISIGDLIPIIIKKALGEDKFNEKVIIETWNRVVPSVISEHVKSIYLNRNNLFIKVDSSVTKHVIITNKTTLIKQLNQNQKNVTIEDLVLN